VERNKGEIRRMTDDGFEKLLEELQQKISGIDTLAEHLSRQSLQ